MDDNTCFFLLFLLLVGSCATCEVSKDCNNASVRKACVAKTGNPECKRAEQ